MGTAEFRIPVARTRRGSVVSVDVARPWHMLVQGMTRSGKSSFVYRLLAGLAQYREVVIAGCDPTGLLLGPLAALPRADLRSFTNADVRRHAAVLASLVDELDRRVFALLETGDDAVRQFSVERPLMLVVVEEYPGLLGALESDDAADGRRGAARLAPAVQRDLRRLVSEGAKVGIRLLTLCQRADAAIIGGAERSNYAFRCTLRVDGSDAARMLHPSASDGEIEAARQFSPGEALLETPGIGLSMVRVLHTSYQDYRAALEASGV